MSASFGTACAARACTGRAAAVLRAIRPKLLGRGVRTAYSGSSASRLSSPGEGANRTQGASSASVSSRSALRPRAASSPDAGAGLADQRSVARRAGWRSAVRSKIGFDDDALARVIEFESRPGQVFGRPASSSDSHARAVPRALPRSRSDGRPAKFRTARAQRPCLVLQGSPRSTQHRRPSETASQLRGLCPVPQPAPRARHPGCLAARPAVQP